MKRILPGGLFVLAGLLAAPIAQGQMVPLSRCHAAFPCSIPFSIQSRPDPLVAGPYSGVGSGGMLVTIPMALPLQPRIEKSRPPDIGQALDADIHRALSHAPAHAPAKPSDENENNLSSTSPPNLTNPPTPPPAETLPKQDQPKQQN
ncbi:MAG TPA: hypothetical protein VF376_02485 [Thermoanaerobaculia bacterium]